MKRNVKRFRIVAVLACFAMCAASCAPTGAGRMQPGPSADVLRVGITPDAPPVIYRESGQVRGLEADFALALGDELGRTVRFVELPWDDKIPSLAAGRIDIVMSGMSVTQTRRSDVAFSDPYMDGGLIALVHRRDVDKFTSPFAFITASRRVAVQTETTGDYFVKKYMKKAHRTGYPTVTEAYDALKAGKVDMMIHDAPVVWYLAASAGHADIVVAGPRLTVEYYAWALSPEARELLDQVNAALARWQADGTLDRTIRKWIPPTK